MQTSVNFEPWTCLKMNQTTDRVLISSLALMFAACLKDHALIKTLYMYIAFINLLKQFKWAILSIELMLSSNFQICNRTRSKLSAHPFVSFSVVGIVAGGYSYMGRVKQIWYLSPVRAAKGQTSLHIRAVSPEPPLLAHTSSESRGTFKQKARSLAPLNGLACAVKICHNGML